MIKIFRKIRQNLLTENLPTGQAGKTSKYLLYATGEIILVVIGILIALSINNWNQKQVAKKQIRNIYAKIIQDFNHTATEIERDVARMDIIQPLMRDVLLGKVNRDSLLTNDAYFRKYFSSTTGYPDIKINETGIRLLESKIELNYELNTELTEALTLLYSEHLFEFEIDAIELSNNFSTLLNYITGKGIKVDYVIDKNPGTFITMIFEDDTFRNYFFEYVKSYRVYKNRLKRFKTKGAILVDRIKTEYNLD